MVQDCQVIGWLPVTGYWQVHYNEVAKGCRLSPSSTLWKLIKVFFV